MAQRKRSPFGALVLRHRNRLGLSRAALALETRFIAEPTANDAGTQQVETNLRLTRLSDRALMDYEQQYDDPADWVSPHPSSVRTLAIAFGLEPGSDDHKAFFEAAASIGGPAPEVDTPPPTQSFVDAGRESQLERIRQAVETAVDGRASFVFVTGDMGTGKTWLIQEACQRAVTLHPDLVSIWASCVGAEGVIDVHQPFRQLVGQMVGAFQMADGRQHASSANRDRLIARIPDAVRALVNRGRGLVRRVLPEDALHNAALSSIDDEALRADVDMLAGPSPVGHQRTQPSPAETSEQLLSVFEEYAGTGPVVLVLDDLHLADATSITTMSHLVRQLHRRRAPLVIIGAARTGTTGIDGSSRQHPMGSVLDLAERVSPGTIVDLSRSTGEADGRAFVRAMIARNGDDPTEQDVDSLFRKTRGQAILVAWFLSTGGWEDGERSFGDDTATSGDAGSNRLPVELKMMFDRQLERLSPEQLTVLFAASVQGESFLPETLMEVLDLSRAEFMELVDAGLVRQEGLMTLGRTVTIAGQEIRAYQFHDAPMRDYVYAGMMGPIERSHYHRDTAEALIERFGVAGHDATGRIAFHFDKAGERGRAALACLNAGDHAVGRREFERAVAWYRRVGELKIRRSDPVTHIRAWIGLGECARHLGQPDRGRMWLDQALALARGQELPVVEGHALEAMAMIDADAGNFQAGIDRMRAVIDIWRTANYRDTPRAMANLSYLLYGQAHYDEAMSQARQGMELASRDGGASMWVDAAIALANCYMDLGMFHEAIAIYDQGRSLAETEGNMHQVHLCWTNIALAYIELDDPDVALDLIERNLTNHHRTSVMLTGYVTLYLGFMAEGRGDLAAAQEHYETSRALRERAGAHPQVVDSLAGLLRVATLCADHARMAHLLADISSRIDERGLEGTEHVGRLFVSMIEASLALGDRAMAVGFARRGVATIRERAAGITDPAQRASYLAVPSRRRLFDLAGSLGVDAPGSAGAA